MDLAHAAVDRWHEPDGLIGIGLGPSAPQRCSRELLEQTLELARARGAGLADPRARDQDAGVHLPPVARPLVRTTARRTRHARPGGDSRPHRLARRPRHRADGEHPHHGRALPAQQPAAGRRRRAPARAPRRGRAGGPGHGRPRLRRDARHARAGQDDRAGAQGARRRLPALAHCRRGARDVHHRRERLHGAPRAPRAHRAGRAAAT